MYAIAEITIKVPIKVPERYANMYIKGGAETQQDAIECIGEYVQFQCYDYIDKLTLNDYIPDTSLWCLVPDEDIQNMNFGDRIKRDLNNEYCGKGRNHVPS